MVRGSDKILSENRQVGRDYCGFLRAFTTRLLCDLFEHIEDSPQGIVATIMKKSACFVF